MALSIEQARSIAGDLLNRDYERYMAEIHTADLLNGPIGYEVTAHLSEEEWEQVREAVDTARVYATVGWLET